ncbi:ribonuclease HIII [Texas Phoenix palm phytoplasma]|uniref:Ribonuclease n=2 Tax=Texas Phoenix palm phytoplasma TaxID=176709 RepID=A0ABS5BIM0_9MOLU|nr:ribonuclease HIII [Texas Phoenix palm phytoplasma]
MNNIRILYKSFLVNNENNNIFFIVNKENIRITVYKNGTLLLQGKIEQKEIDNLKKILGFSSDENNKNNSIYNDYYNYEDIIGSDEVGTGSFFGPVIVCSAFVSKENFIFFKNKGIKDSKKLSNKEIFDLIPLILKKIPYYVYNISPNKYNILKKKLNLNEIKALFHNYAILKLLCKIDKNVKVIVDQFSSSENYYYYLRKEKKVYKEILFETKAEQKYLSVAIASIIGRYFFLKQINQLSKKVNINLKIGCSREVDKQILEIYNSNGLKIFNEIAKCHFKNLQNLLNKINE